MSARWPILNGEALSPDYITRAGISAQLLPAGLVSFPKALEIKVLCLTEAGYGSAFLKSNWAFRIPIWCQLVSSVIVAVGVFFLPESPRWLVAQDRLDEARAILAKYHGEGIHSSIYRFSSRLMQGVGQEDHPIVNLQISEMYYQIQTDASDKRWWDYSALFKTRNARSRLICVMGMAFFGQWYVLDSLLSGTWAPQYFESIYADTLIP